MKSIEQAFDALLERNLDSMRENIALSLSQKAAEALEEKKVQIASTYFDGN